MAKATKPLLVARLYTEDCTTRNFTSEFAMVGINFNFITPNDTENSHPVFASKWDAPISKRSYENLKFEGQLDKSRIGKEKNQEIYGFDITYAKNKLNVNDAKAFVRAVSPINKRIEQSRARALSKMDTHEQGNNLYSFVSHAMFMLQAMNVSGIWFEQYSESAGVSRWYTYSLSELPMLVDKAIELVATRKGWLGLVA